MHLCSLHLGQACYPGTWPTVERTDITSCMSFRSGCSLLRSPPTPQAHCTPSPKQVHFLPSTAPWATLGSFQLSLQRKGSSQGQGVSGTFTAGPQCLAWLPPPPKPGSLPVLVRARIHHGPTLTDSSNPDHSQRPHVLTPPHWGVGFNGWALDTNTPSTQTWGLHFQWERLGKCPTDTEHRFRQ